MRTLLLLIPLLAGCGVAIPAGYKKPEYRDMVVVPVAPEERATSKFGTVAMQVMRLQPKAGSALPTVFSLLGDGGKLRLEPVYTELMPWRSDLALGKHRDQETWQRINLRTGETTALPFARLERIRSGRRPSHGPTAWVGATRQADSRWTVFLLSADGHVVSTLPNVADKSFQEGPQPVDYLPEGGYVAHFDPVGGEPSDVIFNVEGFAISPPLAPLVRMLGDPDTEPTIAHAITLDADRRLYWPLLADGSIVPKPDDALGLRPLPDAAAPRGWAIGWQTAEGPRWAIHARLRIAGAEILDSRAQASFTEVLWKQRFVRLSSGHTTPRSTWFGRDAATGTTMAFDSTRGELEPILSIAVASMAEAEKRVNELSAAATREARAEAAEAARLAQQARVQRELAAKEAKRASRESYLANEREVDRLLGERQFRAAEAIAVQTSMEAIMRVAERTLAAGELDQLDLGTLLVAANKSKNEAGLFRNAARARERQLNGSSPWSYTGNAGQAGWSPPSWQPSQASAPTDYNSSKRIFDNMRQQSMDNYLSGKQSWYFSSNSTTRR